MAAQRTVDRKSRLGTRPPTLVIVSRALTGDATGLVCMARYPSLRPCPQPLAPAIERELASAGATPPPAYEHDWRVFASWCASRGLATMRATPATVAAFLAGEPTASSGRSRSPAAPPRTAPPTTPTPCDSGTTQPVMSGIRRQLGTEVRRQATPLELEPLARVIEPISITTLQGLRDRALLLLGFVAALRRSELVALDVE